MRTIDDGTAGRRYHKTLVLTSKNDIGQGAKHSINQMSENLQAAEQHDWSQMANKASKIKVIDANDPHDTWTH